MPSTLIVHHTSESPTPVLHRLRPGAGPSLPHRREPSVSTAKHGLWDDRHYEPVGNSVPRNGNRPDWLAVAARFSLALFLAAGFAAGSMLTAGTIAKPFLLQANLHFLVWAMALACCVVKLAD
jgi:hypothetical protein